LKIQIIRRRIHFGKCYYGTTFSGKFLHVLREFIGMHRSTRIQIFVVFCFAEGLSKWIFTLFLLLDNIIVGFFIFWFQDISLGLLFAFCRILMSLTKDAVQLLRAVIINWLFLISSTHNWVLNRSECIRPSRIIMYFVYINFIFMLRCVFICFQSPTTIQ